MNFDEYARAIEDFAVYPRADKLQAISYLALGLNGEAGEVAEQIKKAIRNNGEINRERREKILNELGDVLWYLTRMAIEFDSTVGEIAARNFAKLNDRRAQNNLKHK